MQQDQVVRQPLDSLNESLKNIPSPDMELLDFIDEDGRLKSKSSNRMLYEAQIEVIKKQIGDLEQVREALGLTQRKMAQLLMVDPSAWTRWTKSGDRVPPHIFRALQWYMILQEKIPGLTPSYFIGKDLNGKADMIHQKTLSKLNEEAQKRVEFEEAYAHQALKLEKMILSLNNEKKSLQNEVESLRLAVKHNRVGFFMMATSGIIFALAFYWRYLR